AWHLQQAPSVPCRHDGARGPGPPPPRPRGCRSPRRRTAAVVRAGAASRLHAFAARQPLHDRAVARDRAGSGAAESGARRRHAGVSSVDALGGARGSCGAAAALESVRVRRRAVALDLLAGYPQAALQALAATAAWALARARWRAGAPAFLARVVGGVALGVALTAAQALPALDYVRESTVYAFRSTWTPPLAVPPRAMVTALMPYFFGTASSTWSVWQFNITSTYVGLVPLAALPLAAATWRRLPARFFIGLALVAGLVHYGALAAVAPAPVIAFGSNLRLMPVLVFALVTLGAFGVDAVARGESSYASLLVRLRAWFIALAGSGLFAVTLASGEPAALAVRPSLAAQYVAALAGLTAAAWLLRRWLVTGDARWGVALVAVQLATLAPLATYLRSEEHTSELQSRGHL